MGWELMKILMTLLGFPGILRDPRDVKTCLTSECFLANRTSIATLKLVLKRGTVPTFRGGLTSRLWFLFDILPRIVYHA